MEEAGEHGEPTGYRKKLRITQATLENTQTSLASPPGPFPWLLIKAVTKKKQQNKTKKTLGAVLERHYASEDTVSLMAPSLAFHK